MRVSYSFKSKKMQNIFQRRPLSEANDNNFEQNKEIQRNILQRSGPDESKDNDGDIEHEKDHETMIHLKPSSPVGEKPKCSSVVLKFSMLFFFRGGIRVFLVIFISFDGKTPYCSFLKLV